MESGGGGAGGATFDLPEEVLEVLPSDPFDQLDVARKITSIALSTRVSSLEAESSDLRAKLADKDAVIAELQAQIGSLESSLADVGDKLSQAQLEKVRPDLACLFFKFGIFKFFSHGKGQLAGFVAGELDKGQRSIEQYCEEASKRCLQGIFTYSISVLIYKFCNLYII